MDKELAMKWVKALRSCGYRQGSGYLNRGQKYCCLGVLCEVEGISPISITQDDEVNYKYEGGIETTMCFYPGTALKEKRGRFVSLNTSLVELNDSGKTFDEIANIIEQHYEEL